MSRRNIYLVFLGALLLSSPFISTPQASQLIDVPGLVGLATVGATGDTAVLHSNISGRYIPKHSEINFFYSGNQFLPASGSGVTSNIFLIPNASLSDKQALLVSNDTFLDGRRFLPRDAISQGMIIPYLNALHVLKGRSIITHHVLFKSPNLLLVGIRYHSKQIEGKRMMLASVILIDTKNSSYIIKDFPSEYDPSSTWKAHDNADVPWPDIQILLVSQFDKKYEIALTWPSKKDVTLIYLRQNRDQFDTVIEETHTWSH